MIAPLLMQLIYIKFWRGTWGHAGTQPPNLLKENKTENKSLQRKAEWPVWERARNPSPYSKVQGGTYIWALLGTSAIRPRDAGRTLAVGFCDGRGRQGFIANTALTRGIHIQRAGRGEWIEMPVKEASGGAGSH